MIPAVCRSANYLVDSLMTLQPVVTRRMKSLIKFVIVVVVVSIQEGRKREKVCRKKKMGKEKGKRKRETKGEVAYVL